MSVVGQDMSKLVVSVIPSTLGLHGKLDYHDQG